MCEACKTNSSVIFPGLFAWFPCHKREDRSFHFHGKTFPICARCTAILAGYAILPIWMGLHIHLAFWWSLVLCVPLVVDGYTQRWKWRTSNNLLRFATGFAFGVGQCIIIATAITLITHLLGI